MAMLEARDLRKSFYTYAKPGLQAGIFHKPGARKVVSQLFDKCRDLSLFELIGVYNQVSSGMKMSLSAVDILSVLSQGYGLMTSDADFVEFRIPQDGTYSYSSIGSSSVLDVRWKTNKARFHELLDNE